MLAMPDYPYAIFPDPEHLPHLPESLLADGRNYLERLQQRASPEDFAVFAARPENTSIRRNPRCRLST